MPGGRARHAVKIAALGLVALLAACGGGQRPPGADEEPEPPIPQSPAGVDREVIRRETELVEDLAKRGCACQDAACFEAIDVEERDYFREQTLNDPITGIETWPADLRARSRRAYRSLHECMKAMDFDSYSYGVVLVRRVVQFRDLACACGDSTCARATELRFDEIAELHENTLLDAAALEEIGPRSAEMRQCLERHLHGAAQPGMPAREAPRREPTEQRARGSVGFEQHVSRIDALVRGGCACRDRRCVARIDRELGDLVTAVRREPVPEAAATRVGESAEQLKRLSVCMTDHEVASPAFGQAIVARVTEVTTAVCACSDIDCAKREVGSLLPEITAMDSFPLEPEELETLQQLGRELTSCVNAFSGPIAELRAVRDQACACTEIPCAELAKAAFQGLLDKHRNTRGTDSEANEFARLASELSDCLSDVGVEL